MAKLESYKGVIVIILLGEGVSGYVSRLIDGLVPTTLWMKRCQVSVGSVNSS